jgi:serine phosphatase RsbU (regulator of sigma subunit)
VKGEVLGVLLVEEPDPLPLESQSSLSANRRLRSKRLEITTGISQQVALAIQNDQLQREMVERERLEREMQLARDIQRTFLPDQIPHLPGWDMDALWQTAREVGGDFYDFFSLPDRRLGLVIADVADKGMPAALFMTLVRTLVRATVQEFDSPAAVLKRVNDVLVPDARGGMFVTLFYAVVDLESGRVTYANAGHNPPLVANSSGSQITRLPKTGMALGVLETSQYSQQSTDLQPGDALVLYTDGITEAFSPEGELFGEDRLHQVVAAAMQAAREPDANGAAREIVSAVEAAVATFLGPAAPGDDLTLLVLQRSLGDGEAG